MKKRHFVKAQFVDFWPCCSDLLATAVVGGADLDEALFSNLKPFCSHSANRASVCHAHLSLTRGFQMI